MLMIYLQLLFYFNSTACLADLCFKYKANQLKQLLLSVEVS